MQRNGATAEHGAEGGRQVKITVTKQDIRTGCLHDSKACPVALALARATGRAARVFIEYGCKSSHLVSFDDELRGKHLPLKVSSFIEQFDGSTDRDRRKMKPFSFTLK
jgi:hypothetical protein